MAKRFIRQCPHCKSKIGFKITYILGGYHDILLNYKGKVIDEDRKGCDTLDSYAECMSCKRSIEVEKLDFNI